MAAITKEEKTVFRVSDRKSLEQLYEQAEAKRDQLNTKVEKHHDEFERLGHELTRHDNFLSKVLTGEVGEEKLPNIFEGRPTLRDHAAEIVKKYRSDPDSLPEGHGAMGKFKENWTPDSSGVTGHSKVNMIQRAIREVSLADKYNDPESFCDLVERLVKRHDTVQP